MKVLIQIAHPAHVHFYREFISEALKKGNKIRIICKNKDITIELLNSYGIDHDVIFNANDEKTVGLIDQFRYEWRTLRAIRAFNPDVITGIGGTAASHAAALTDTKSFIFTDTENAIIANQITFPFADRIYTPDCFRGEAGSNQIQYPGYHELAYLHPRRFEPNPSVLNDVGLEQSDRFVILRLINWNAVHDIGDSGLSNIENVVESLESTGVRVFITAEGDVPPSLEHCLTTVEPHRMHDLMYFADLCIGESATMASESAVLGTPAVFVSSSSRGYTDELEKNYGLVFNFSGSERHTKSLKQALSILREYDYSKWQQRRSALLEDKIDTTDFILDEFESANP